MTKFFLGTLGAILTVGAAAFGVLSIAGGASAADPADDSSDPAASTQPRMLAVAIGQLSEDGGETATVDLRAGDKDGKERGNLRFFSEDDGYYNGGVRDVSCEGGVITARGGGGLVQPDGTRVRVAYEATFDKATGEATIHVRGRDIDYTMQGEVDGLIWCGDPTQAPPAIAES